MKLDGKTILVTGHMGFLGKNLVRRLIKENSEVIGLDNMSLGYPDKAVKDIEFIKGDVTDKKTFQKLQKRDIGWIFHLASPSSVIQFNRDPVNSFNTAIDSFLNVIEFAKQNDIKVIFPSSSSVYGASSIPQTETLIPRPLNMYATAKTSCEQISNYFPDVDITFLRIFVGYGPFEDHKKDFKSPMSLFLNTMIKNERPLIFGTGEQLRDFVYVDDVVTAFINSMYLKGRNIINVGSGVSHSFNLAIETINEILGKKIKPVYVQKPINYLERTQADTNLMRELLRVKPMDIREGLRKYVNFLEGTK